MSVTALRRFYCVCARLFRAPGKHDSAISPPSHRGLAAELQRQREVAQRERGGGGVNRAPARSFCVTGLGSRPLLPSVPLREDMCAIVIINMAVFYINLPSWSLQRVSGYAGYFSVFIYVSV